MDKVGIHRWTLWGPVITVVLVSVAALTLVIVALALSYARETSHQQDRYNSCLVDRRLYDSQVKYTKFLARQFHATQAQLDAGLADLKNTLGDRPECAKP